MSYEDLLKKGLLPADEVEAPVINFCVITAAEKRMSIPISAVKEITDAAAIMPLPGSPPHIRGLIQLRGVVIPVVDLSRLFGTRSNPHASKKLIIMEYRGELFSVMSEESPDLLEEHDGEIVDIDRFFEEYRVK
ncbi:MAG: hypothetical protein BV458_06455 [Thermoplasmata archaeon M9B2D]|nr:MAG: hypothetical protein BV458_06455 [Thermoplasmata archaeon M9B2D]